MIDNKYLRRVHITNSGLIDVYEILEAFKISCPARQHAIKKLLCAGLRGSKSTEKDLYEAYEAVIRAIDLELLRTVKGEKKKHHG